jgi:hypothetical protein
MKPSKNIHVLKTDKPSRLWVNNLLQGKLELSEEVLPYNTSQNIYITSDEEIKEDEYYLGQDNNIYCLVTSVNFKGKKIILTTDGDLIKEGVQSIDDEFLQWYIKNPSCEEVDYCNWNEYYKITPKEEPKQETTADYIDRHIVEAMVEVAKQKMYSEEEVINIIYKIYDEMGISISLEDVVKQFKK